MMRKTVFTIIMCVTLSCPVFANTINNVEFDIPDTWDVVHETEDGTTAAYSYNDEYVMISVSDLNFDAKDFEEMFLVDCDAVFGEKEGYYLMTNEREEKDNHLLAVQECVYLTDDGEWFYAWSGSRFFDDHMEVIIYQSPINSTRVIISDFGVLFNEHILG